VVRWLKPRPALPRRVPGAAELPPTSPQHLGDGPAPMGNEWERERLARLAELADLGDGRWIIETASGPSATAGTVRDNEEHPPAKGEGCPGGQVAPTGFEAVPAKIGHTALVGKRRLRTCLLIGHPRL
jgi:hypothetical protein